MKSLVITLIGDDKPGIVDCVAKVVRNHQGNWLGSRFAHMAGQFAGFVEINLPKENADKLVAELKNISGLHLHTVDTQQSETDRLEVASFSIMGNDKPGIVNEITSVLQQFNVNIIEFDSECISAPNWGNLMFQAEFKVAIPEDVQMDDIQNALEEITNDLVVDIEFG